MAKGFQLPKVSLRQASLALSALVLAIGAAWLFRSPAPPPALTPDEVAIQDFRNICVKEARHANGGGDLVMDNQTEAMIGGYCGCVADGMAAKVSPLEIAKLSTGEQSDDTLKLLDAVVADCKAEHLK